MDGSERVKWMRLALEEAKLAMEVGEIPVASVLVGGGMELGRGQTLVKRKESIAAHGELFVLLEAKGKIYSAKRPLEIYTTLEPCVMCLGAAMQTGVDRIIYGMDAAPDGGTRYVNEFRRLGQAAPEIISGVLVEEQVALMREFLKRYPNSPAAPYVRAMLEPYSKS